MNQNINKSNLEPCKHEEADTRIFLHIYDAAINSGLKKAMIGTVDTDVVVIGKTFYLYFRLSLSQKIFDVIKIIF